MNGYLIHVNFSATICIYFMFYSYDEFLVQLYILFLMTRGVV